jgi:hypothetical protein
MTHCYYYSVFLDSRVGDINSKKVDLSRCFTGTQTDCLNHFSTHLKELFSFKYSTSFKDNNTNFENNNTNFKDNINIKQSYKYNVERIHDTNIIEISAYKNLIYDVGYIEISFDYYSVILLPMANFTIHRNSYSTKTILKENKNVNYTVTITDDKIAEFNSILDKLMSSNFPIVLGYSNDSKIAALKEENKL